MRGHQFDLIFGNPPTLSPSLTGRDVFYATGTLEAFRSLLAQVCRSLKGHGRALLTLFSEASPSHDETFECLQSELGDKRGFRYRVRREYPLSENRILRHCVLELLGQETDTYEFIPLSSKGLQLPAIQWRR